MAPHLRVARPVTDVLRTDAMYRAGLGLSRVGSFFNHGGFDGVMLGTPGGAYHFEFTYCRTHPVPPTPTAEDLLVFYVPDEADWQARCEAMLAAGFVQVPSLNPWWDARGRTFADHDGYRVVIERAAWTSVTRPPRPSAPPQ